MPSWLQQSPVCGIEHRWYHYRSGVRATAAQHSQAVPSTAGVVVLHYHQWYGDVVSIAVAAAVLYVNQWYGIVVYTKPALTAWALHTANQESGLVNTHRVNLYGQDRQQSVTSSVMSACRRSNECRPHVVSTTRIVPAAQ